MLKLNEQDSANDIENDYFSAVNSFYLMAEFDREGAILYANDAYCQTLGYSLNELRNLHHNNICDTKFNIQFLEGQQFIGEVKCLTKGRKALWFQCSYIPVKNSKGDVYKIMKMAVDITFIKEELAVRKTIMDLTCIVSESNLKGEITAINDKFCETSQYQRHELLGQPHSLIRHPDVSSQVFKKMWGDISKGKIFRGIIKNRKKDGTAYYVDAVIAPILGDDGKPKKYLGVRYDITERESERHNMKAIIKAIDATFASVEFDVEGYVLSSNKIFQDLMNYGHNEIEGLHHRQFVVPEYAKTQSYKHFWEGLVSGVSQSDVFKRMTKDGKEVWLQSIYTPVMDEMGRVMKVMFMGVDITEQKIRDAENAVQVMAINKVQSVAEFSLEGTILSANEKFLMTFGYKLEDITGHNHQMFCEDSEVLSLINKGLWQRLARGEYQSGRYKRIGARNKVIWIQAFYNPVFDLNGKVIKVIQYSTDVTLEVEVEAVVMKMADEFSASATDISAGSSKVAYGANALSETMDEMLSSIDGLKSSLELSAKGEATIGQINDTSLKIKEIVKVISEIAHQTNYLAFDAAIEAAKASDQGLGFSVVADEVRKLAVRSSQAAYDISKLINGKSKKV